MQNQISLEKAAAEVCAAAAQPPLIFQIPPKQGREVLEKLQNDPVYMYPASIKDIVVNTGKWGQVKVFIVCPEEITPSLNVIFYNHGGGWVFGSFHTHEKLIRELAARTGSVVIFPEYSRAPEAKYPVAIEQCYDIMCKIPSVLYNGGIQEKPCTLILAGDSAGGNMAIALTFLAMQRSGPVIQKLLLYYPVTNACFDTKSYIRFAEGYYLYRQGMIWFWNQYTASACDRCRITASPLKAAEEQLKGFPDTMILNGEADVLRDEGEAFACRLREAGVNVTAISFQGMIHDFVMLNALDCTNACRAAMNVSVDWINETDCCSPSLSFSNGKICHIRP